MSLKYSTTSAATESAATTTETESDYDILAGLAAADSIEAALENEDESGEDEEKILSTTSISSPAPTSSSQAAFATTAILEKTSTINRIVAKPTSSAVTNSEITSAKSTTPASPARVSPTTITTTLVTESETTPKVSRIVAAVAAAKATQAAGRTTRSSSITVAASPTRRRQLFRRSTSYDDTLDPQEGPITFLSLENGIQTAHSSRGHSFETLDDQGRTPQGILASNGGASTPGTISRQISVGPSTVSFGSQPNRAMLEALRDIDLPAYSPRADTWPRRARLSIDRQILGVRGAADDDLNQIIAMRRRRTRRAPCCGMPCTQCCLKCILTCTSIRGILAGIGILGAGCVVGGIVLGAINLTGSGYVVVSVILISLGLILVIMICVGWRCVPDGQEPCHSLCKLNEGGERGLPGHEAGPTLGGPLAQLNQQRGSSQWYGGVLYSDYQYGPPPPAYTATVNQIRRSASVVTSATAADLDNASIAGSIPPTYRSHISTRPSIFQNIFGGGSGSSYVPPPAYERQVSNLSTRSAQSVTGIVNPAFIDSESGVQITRETSIQENLQALFELPTMTPDGTIMISLSSSEDSEKAGSSGTVPQSTSQFVSVPPPATLSTISEEIFPDSRRGSVQSPRDFTIVKFEDSIMGITATSLKDLPDQRHGFGDDLADEAFVVDIEPNNQESQQTNLSLKPTERIALVEIHREPESDTSSEAGSSTTKTNETGKQSNIGHKDIGNQNNDVRIQIDETRSTDQGASKTIGETEYTRKGARAKDAQDSSNNEITAVPVLEEIPLRRTSSNPDPPVSPKPMPVVKILNATVSSGGNQCKTKVVRSRSHGVPLVAEDPKPKNPMFVGDTISFRIESVSSSGPDFCETTSKAEIVRTFSNSSEKSLSKPSYTPTKYYQSKITSLVSPDSKISSVGAKSEKPLESGNFSKNLKECHTSKGSLNFEKAVAASHGEKIKEVLSSSADHIGRSTTGNLALFRKPASAVRTESSIIGGNCIRPVGDEEKQRPRSLEGIAQENRIRTWSVSSTSGLKKPFTGGDRDRFVDSQIRSKPDSLDVFAQSNGIKTFSVASSRSIGRPFIGVHCDEDERQRKSSLEGNFHCNRIRTWSVGSSGRIEKTFTDDHRESLAGKKERPKSDMLKGNDQGFRVGTFSVGFSKSIENPVALSPKNWPVCDEDGIRTDSVENSVQGKFSVGSSCRIQKPFMDDDCNEQVGSESNVKQDSFETDAQRNRIRRLNVGSCSSLKDHHHDNIIVNISPLRTKSFPIDGKVTDNLGNSGTTPIADDNFYRLQDQYRAESVKIRSQCIAKQPLSAGNSTSSTNSNCYKPRSSPDKSQESITTQTSTERFRKLSHDERLVFSSHSSTQALRPGSMHPYPGEISSPGISAGESHLASLSSERSPSDGTVIRSDSEASSKILSNSNNQNLTQTDTDSPLTSVRKARELFVMLDRNSSNQARESKSIKHDQKGVQKSNSTLAVRAGTLTDSKSPHVSQTLEAVHSHGSKSSLSGPKHRLSDITRPNLHHFSEFD